jgi:uncharacterized membrane protein YqiK
MADRSQEIALKRVEEEGLVEAAKAETEAKVVARRAEGEAQAVRTRAEAERLRLLAESEGIKARIAAENTRGESLLKLELERYRLDKLPGIVAELIKPAEKIDSIRIHQVNGLSGVSGAPGANGEPGARPPVNQVLDSILGMALQLPALKSIGESIGYDFSSAMPGRDEPEKAGKAKDSK